MADTRIDINCDMGESFGNWEMGRDEEVMAYITSANVAGGFHAGDPHVMDRTVSLAAKHDVDIGVHPGLPDKTGFGRRKIEASPEELRDYVIYQLGALDAFARRQGTRIQHVKPHGAMYSMLSDSPEHARAVMEAILEVDPELVYLATDMHIYEVTQEFEDVRAVFEGYVDLRYNPDRSLIVERELTPKPSEEVVERFVSIATEGVVEADNGETVEVPAQSICVHGDGPNAVEYLERIHDAAAEHDIELVGLDALA